jgi:hypothetical protein
MRLFVIFIYLVSTFSCIAQKSGEPRVLFKLAPLALIDDLGFPAIQGGVEVALSNKISWFNEFGFRYRKALAEIADTSFITPVGYKIKSEFRYYLKGRNDGNSRLSGYYLAINLFYLKNVRNTTVYYYYQKDTGNRVTDDFGISKKIWGGNLIVGKQMNLGKRFMFEYYGGLGLRIRDNVTVGRDYDRDRDQESRGHHLSVNDMAGGDPDLREVKRLR